MNALLSTFITQIESAIRLANQERAADGVSPFGQVRIRLLGQFGLLVHPQAAAALRPAATRDVDALVEGDWSTRWIVRTAINLSGYVYDDLSSENWIPAQARFELLSESAELRVEVLAPIFNLLSKAVKAPERNRNLIVEGIAVYGDEFVHLLQTHGADIEYFLGKSSRGG